MAQQPVVAIGIGHPLGIVVDKVALHGDPVHIVVGIAAARVSAARLGRLHQPAGQVIAVIGGDVCKAVFHPGQQPPRVVPVGQYPGIAGALPNEKYSV